MKVKALKVSQTHEGQSNGEIYVTKIPVRDLIDSTQFTMDVWRPERKGTDDQGYQRDLDEKRIRSIASYVEKRKGSIFPNAILVSCRKPLEFEEEANGFGELSIGNKVNQYPLYIIDGQHRVRGLWYAVTQNGHEDLAALEMPVIILSNFEKKEEVRQFFSLNFYQKKVDTSLAQRLMAELAYGDRDEMQQIKDDQKDWQLAALKLIDMLNENVDSAWKNSIKIPGGGKKPSHIINQNSFLTSLKPLFGPGAVFSIQVRKLDDRYRLLEEYWGALAETFPDAFNEPKDYVIQKTPGVFSLNAFAPHVFAKVGLDDASRKSLKELLKKVFLDNGITSDYWRKDTLDGAANYGSMKGFRILTDKFLEYLDELN